MGFTFDQEDPRPPFIAYDVNGLTLDNFKTQKPAGVETMRLEKVKNLCVSHSPGLADQKAETIANAKE